MSKSRLWLPTMVCLATMLVCCTDWQEGVYSQKKMNKKSKNTIAMLTGCDLAPAADVGVCVSTLAQTSMHRPMPTPPTIRRNFLPNRSTVQTALSVKIMPHVALRALINMIV